MARYFTTTEVARLCHVSAGTVVRWIRDSKLKAAVTPGGHRRIYLEDLLKFLKTLRMVIPRELRQQEAGSFPRVLLVDDEEQICRMLTVFIKNEFPNVQVRTAGNGFHAGWILHQQTPDLVILDIKLPGIDGFHVCKMIREIPELKRTRIIVITGHGEENKEQALKAGADYFLTKPFDMTELRRAIADLLAGIEKEAKRRGA